jgi:hypothetical protein
MHAPGNVLVQLGRRGAPGVTARRFEVPALNRAAWRYPPEGTRAWGTHPEVPAVPGVPAILGVLLGLVGGQAALGLDPAEAVL